MEPSVMKPIHIPRQAEREKILPLGIVRVKIGVAGTTFYKSTLISQSIFYQAMAIVSFILCKGLHISIRFEIAIHPSSDCNSEVSSTTRFGWLWLYLARYTIPLSRSPWSRHHMASFCDAPLEVIGEIIDSLQDDLPALRSCSQTCLSLLPLCRKYIFRTIILTPRLHPLPRYITLFRNLLDSNPGVADYVQNLKYQVTFLDFEDEAVPRTLGKLHRIQSFHLIGSDWHLLQPALQQSLSYIISLPSITRLEIYGFRLFPINMFIPGINLIDLTLSSYTNNHEYEYFAPDAVAQLQSLTLRFIDGEDAKNLMEARRSKDVPVLDFSNLRALVVDVEKHSQLAAVHALTKVAEKLETFHYFGLYQTHLRLYAGTEC